MGRLTSERVPESPVSGIYQRTMGLYIPVNAQSVNKVHSLTFHCQNGNGRTEVLSTDILSSAGTFIARIKKIFSRFRTRYKVWNGIREMEICITFPLISLFLSLCACARAVMRKCLAKHHIFLTFRGKRNVLKEKKKRDTVREL